MTLGEKIKNVRKKAGLTQADFAELVSNNDFKIGNTTVSNWEKNINKPDIEIISTICYKLNISADYFIEPKIQKNQPEKFSKKTIDQLKKYNALDEYGKKAVDGLLETEYERCTSINTKESQSDTQSVTTTAGELEDQWKAEQVAKNKDA